MPDQVGTFIEIAGSLIIGGPGIVGMWPPLGVLIPGADPTGLIPGGGSLLLASWEGLPHGVQASFRGKEDSGDSGEVGPWPLQEEEQKMELEVSFLVEMQLLCCQVGSWPALPFLVIVFHGLFVFPTTAVSLSHRWRTMAKMHIAVVTINFGMLFRRPWAAWFCGPAFQL